MITLKKVFYERGDIVMVDLGGCQREGTSLQFGRRPCIIISNSKGNFFSPILSVVPMTTKKMSKQYPTHLPIKKSEANRMLYDSVALCEQGLTIDKSQVLFPIGRLEDEYIEPLNHAVGITLGLVSF